MTPTSEATDRVQLVFSLFDADGNGYLERDRKSVV